LDPYTYQYLNATTQRNRDPPVSWEGYYSTDVLAEKAYGLLNDAIALRDPFFVAIAASAPHSNVEIFDPERGAYHAAGFMTEPILAEQHKHQALFLYRYTSDSLVAYHGSRAFHALTPL
jgi:N-acetylglucosamine-6-sulfatase